jgi:tRNA(adenine34) deaminase
MNDDLDYLQAAIAEARSAEQAGEVPIGAIIVHQNEIIARGQNRVLRDHDPTAHAEIVALRQAGRALENYRLAENCTLYTTLEPCAMCAGAILHARIARLVYAAPDPKAGACGSVLAVMNHPQLNHKVEVTSGLLAEECGALLTNFFRARR